MTLLFCQKRTYLLYWIYELDLLFIVFIPSLVNTLYYQWKDQIRPERGNYNIWIFKWKVCSLTATWSVLIKKTILYWSQRLAWAVTELSVHYYRCYFLFFLLSALVTFLIEGVIVGSRNFAWAFKSHIKNGVKQKLGGPPCPPRLIF